MTVHRTTKELEAQVDHIQAAPSDSGVIELIVRRPAGAAREVIQRGELDPEIGLVGDNWRSRAEAMDPTPDRHNQLTLMNARVTQAVAGAPARWPLAGDQIYVDLDLSVANLPPGTRLAVGDAIIEISSTPHTGCAKFAERFGAEALRFVNVGPGRDGRYRGVNAHVVAGGSFALGDRITKC